MRLPSREKVTNAVVDKTMVVLAAAGDTVGGRVGEAAVQHPIFVQGK